NGVPKAGDNVLIALGTDVTVDAINRQALHTIRVDGTLEFSTTQNSGLVVDTIIVEPEGTLDMGTAANPVPQGVEAKIRIQGDGNPIDTNWDPSQFSRGLVSHGDVQVHGAAKTSFMAVAGNGVARGTTLSPVKTITLANVPTNWQPGDRLVLTGTS